MQSSFPHKVCTGSGVASCRCIVPAEARSKIHTLSKVDFGGSANTDTARRLWGLGRAGAGAGVGGVGMEAAAAAQGPGCCWATGLGFGGGGGGGGG